MNPEDRAAAAFQRLEHAMDTANDLIGELIRRLDDGRPRCGWWAAARRRPAPPATAALPVCASWSRLRRAERRFRQNRPDQTSEARTASMAAPAAAFAAWSASAA